MPRGARYGLLAGLFLTALSLRPQLVGVGPLIPEIQDDLDVSHAVAGLLATIPVLCMGLFAPPARRLSGRLGWRIALAVSLGLIAGFGLLRAAAPSAALLVLLTIPVGVGIGLGGALMPVAVKARFASRPAFVTGIYSVGIVVGAAASSAVAVPFAEATGGWRASLLLFSGLTGVLVVAWLVLTRREEPHRRSEEQPVPLPWRNGLAWQLVAIFGVMSMAYYGFNAWLPDAYVERGWSEGEAGALVAVMNAGQIVPALTISWLADRWGSRRLYLSVFAALMSAATLGLVLAPGEGWAWAALVGAGFGVLFPLVMTLPLDIAPRPADVAAVAGMMLGVGYSVSSVSPLALGALRDATGSFDGVLWALFAFATTLFVLCLALSRERLAAGAIEPAAS
jgi:CP family cyanate transporter-like MFS transporter